MQRIAVQQVNGASLLALAGPPIGASPVGLGVLADNRLNFLWEFHIRCGLFATFYKLLRKQFNFILFSLKYDEDKGLSQKSVLVLQKNQLICMYLQDYLYVPFEHHQLLIIHSFLIFL